MMVGWWRSRPDAELYSPKWRWMVTLKKYYCQVSTRAAREVATAAQRGETNYVTFIINELKLQHSNEIQEVVSRRLIELFRELHRAIVARGYRNDRDYDFRKAVHVLLDQWSNEVVTGNGTSSTGREDEGEIDETLLRRTFAIIVLSKIEDEFANLRLFENGYRFHAAELDNMEQMNVDAKTEEFIAAAAVFQKPIVILDLFYVDDDMSALVHLGDDASNEVDVHCTREWDAVSIERPGVVAHVRTQGPERSVECLARLCSSRS